MFRRHTGHLPACLTRRLRRHAIQNGPCAHNEKDIGAGSMSRHTIHRRSTAVLTELSAACGIGGGGNDAAGATASELTGPPSASVPTDRSELSPAAAQRRLLAA